MMNIYRITYRQSIAMKMVFIRFIFSLLFFMTTLTFFGQVKNLVRQGNDYYHQQQYQEADSLYQLAIIEVDSFIPAIYNDGLALYHLNKFVASESSFSKVLLNSDDDTLKANSYFNMGNVALKQWYKTDAHLGLIKMNLDQLTEDEHSEVEDKMEIYLLKDSLLKEQKELLTNKENFLEKAIGRYKSCLRLNPADDDARYNLVYAYKLRPLDPKKEEPKEEQEKEEQKPTAYALEMKKKALELVSKNKFVEAYHLLNNAKQKDPTIGKFNKLIQKLEVITKIKEK